MYNDKFRRVEVSSASSDTYAAVGQGKQLVQFFYSNEEVGEPMAMPSVLVNTDEEVNYVAAIVAEMAEEYERRKDPGRFQQQIDRVHSRHTNRALPLSDKRSTWLRA